MTGDAIIRAVKARAARFIADCGIHPESEYASVIQLAMMIAADVTAAEIAKVLREEKPTDGVPN